MNKQVLTQSDVALLGFLSENPHVTTADIHRYASESTRTKRSTERQLAGLRHDRFIAADALRPEEGGASPLRYHLLAKGARAIGIARLGQQHYRRQRRDFYAARKARMELRFLAGQYGWQLMSDESSARRVLSRFLLAASRREFSEQFPEHTIVSALPLKVEPDWILNVAGREAVIIIVAHPHSTSGFWRRRCEKYKAVFPIARAIAVVLEEHQRRGAERAVRDSAFSGRVLIVAQDQLVTAFERLARSHGLVSARITEAL